MQFFFDLRLRFVKNVLLLGQVPFQIEGWEDQKVCSYCLHYTVWVFFVTPVTMYACSIKVNMSFKESIILWILFFYRTERKTLRSSSRKWRKETQASWTVSGWKWKMKRNFEGFFFKSRQSSVVYIQKLVNTSTFTQVEQDTVADWCFDV